ncbi:MAG TPA: Bax inhibitor-1/YccA family protein [Xanthobacteraceae bacterium]|nr:Bax inhibitor-1/YccA family protein [Xanthobacteraceae bacterium]
MSNFDPNYAVRGVSTDRTAAEIDQGLRSYMIAVYNYMAIGVALTGVAAWLAYSMAGGDAINPRNIMATATPFGQMLYSTVGLIVMFVATFGLVMAISFLINRMSPALALGLFMLYAALLGVFLSTIFIQYTGASITRVFFISAASFGALSLYGYTTQRDLTAMGSFLMMGLIGLLLAMIVNMFWPNGMLGFIISVAGVLIFAGLTAYDTQKIKEMYDASEDGTITGRKAVMGALTLYLDFINLFLFMLRLIGDRR